MRPVIDRGSLEAFEVGHRGVETDLESFGPTEAAGGTGLGDVLAEILDVSMRRGRWRGSIWRTGLIVRLLLEAGWDIAAEDLGRISPYLTEHINRFGEYGTHELGIRFEAYAPKLGVDFTPLRELDLAAAGFGTAAWAPWTRSAAPRTDRSRLPPACLMAVAARWPS
ncbi:hypothetical protein ACIQCF_37990 [Streptomyces sp. NPDC088353]|uniref:hypothetical protein n=1 Tax=Streptomyces sp. NPDC088353 TaxID=3365855 RepID=UPI00380B35B9